MTDFLSSQRKGKVINQLKITFILQKASQQKEKKSNPQTQTQRQKGIL